MHPQPYHPDTNLLSTPEELSELAHERADRYAPRTTMSPLLAGTLGTLTMLFSLMVFAKHARTMIDFDGVAVALLGLSFLLPLAYVYFEDRVHHRAWAREYQALKAINDRAAVSRAAYASLR